MVEVPPSIPAGTQAVGRARRLGNPSSVVYIYEYSLRNTFSAPLNALNLTKALLAVMTELDGRLFQHESGEGDDGDEFELGEWIIVEDKLCSVDDPAVGPDPKILTPEELPEEILLQMKGQRVVARPCETNGL